MCYAIALFEVDDVALERGETISNESDLFGLNNVVSDNSVLLDENSFLRIRKSNAHAAKYRKRAVGC